MRAIRLSLIPLLLLALACSSTRSTSPVLSDPVFNPAKADLREDDDPSNVFYTFTIERGKIVSSSRGEIPKGAISTEPSEQKDVKEPEPAKPGKIHPLLEKWIASRDGSSAEPVVVTFRDNLQIPRFPEPSITEDRDSETNKRVLARNAELIEGIRAKRAQDYASLKALEAAGARVTEQFWLVRAVEAKMPLGAVRELAAQEDVLYVEPVQTEDPPPQNDVVDGRARINSDPYFNLGQTGGFIGLLDSGIRNTHVQFNGPSHIAFLRDCVNGGANCNTGALNTADDCWNHGTSSAAIITANAVQGGQFRGVTAITLDSFKVFPSTFNGTNCTGGLSTTAAVRGFQTAIAVADRVIVAEMQGSGDHTSAVSVAADNAFDAGAVIIAANGNNGPGAGTVNSPANAHRVIGVGNFDVQTQAQIGSQSRGPTTDSRTKPDIQAPTNTDTASTGCPFGVSCAQSNTAQRNFGGTSGSTPYAAGAAALVRNFLRGGTGTIEPGFVYAYLIMSGQQPAFNNTTGAGPIRLPVNGTFATAKVGIFFGQTIDIPFNVGAGKSRVDAAIWWPENTLLPHNDVDLRLVNPSGVVVASSVSVNSVFERARATPAPAGTWQVRIRAFSVPLPQTVFMAVSTE
jgi:hypothetical protein